MKNRAFVAGGSTFHSSLALSDPEASTYNFFATAHVESFTIKASFDAAMYSSLYASGRFDHIFVSSSSTAEENAPSTISSVNVLLLAIASATS
jgi:hypothetical protein